MIRNAMVCLVLPVLLASCGDGANGAGDTRQASPKLANSHEALPPQPASRLRVRGHKLDVYVERARELLANEDVKVADVEPVFEALVKFGAAGGKVLRQYVQHPSAGDSAAIHLGLVGTSAAASGRSLVSLVTEGKSRPALWIALAQTCAHDEEVAEFIVKRAKAVGTPQRVDAIRALGYLKCCPEPVRSALVQALRELAEALARRKFGGRMDLTKVFLQACNEYELDLRLPLAELQELGAIPTYQNLLADYALSLDGESRAQLLQLLLESDSQSKHESALIVLHRLEDVRLSVELQQRLAVLLGSSYDARVRWNIAIVFEEKSLDRKLAIPPLLRATYDAEWRVRKFAIAALGQYVDEPSVRARIQAIAGSREERPSVVSWARAVLQR